MVTCSDSSARIAVEIFVKKNQITPMRISVELFEVTKYRAAAFVIAVAAAAAPIVELVVGLELVPLHAASAAENVIAAANRKLFPARIIRFMSLLPFHVALK